MTKINPQLVIFDMDQTLIDTKESIFKCINYTLNKFNLPPASEDAVFTNVGPTLNDILSKLIPGINEADLKNGVSIYRKYFTDEGYKYTKPFDQVPEILSKLFSTKKIYLATTRYRLAAESILKEHKLTQYFNGIYGLNPDGTHADKSEQVKEIMFQSKADPKNSIMVGDHIDDVKAGKDNGLLTIKIGENHKSKADYSINSISELFQIID